MEEEFKASVIEPTPTGEELAKDDVEDTEALIEMVRTQQSNLDLAVANQLGMATPKKQTRQGRALAKGKGKKKKRRTVSEAGKLVPSGLLGHTDKKDEAEEEFKEAS